MIIDSILYVLFGIILEYLFRGGNIEKCWYRDF